MRVLIFLAAGLLLNALGLYAQDDPLPDGEGKKVVQKLCLDCHGPENIVNKKLTKAGWEKVIDEMVKMGANGTDDEFATIVAYLTKNFGKPDEKQQH